MVKYKVIAEASYKKEQRSKEMLSFLYTLWLPHGQLWVIIEETVSLDQS